MVLIMKKNLFLLIFGVLVSVTFLLSCQQEKTNLKYETQSLQLPATTPDYTVQLDQTVTPNGGFTTLPLTAPKINSERAQLGRVLFYDKKLSLNNTVACASCHKQALGFADDVRFSNGFNQEKTTRNSMAISNCAFTTDFFWDGRSKSLTELVLQPARNHIEMGMENSTDIVEKLKKVDYYPALFGKAFDGNTEITKDRVIQAMSDFLNSMVSNNSKFDQGKKVNFSNFTAAEKLGQALFQQQCSSCHAGFNLNSNEWDTRTERANIGLDVTYTDKGMGAIESSMEGIFKVPSLRNVGLSAPYMHDGRFATLSDVVEHYNQNIQAHPNLDWRLQNNKGGVINVDPVTGIPVNNFQMEGKKMNFTEADKKNLIAFLNTFTDNKFATDTRFANPFK
jgi:cytochrome c peroxidase